jgi:hypothetical protein
LPPIIVGELASENLRDRSAILSFFLLLIKASYIYPIAPFIKEITMIFEQLRRIVSSRRNIYQITMICLIVSFYGCGGSDSSSNNSHNGSNNNSNTTGYTATLAPSKIMTGRSSGGFRILTDHDLPNINDPNNRQTIDVYVNEEHAQNIDLINLRTLDVGILIDGGLPGFRTVKVAIDGKTQYTAQLEVYSPQLAQNPFNTTTGYFVSSTDADPDTIVLADLNRDGYQDVIWPGNNPRLYVLNGNAAGDLGNPSAINVSGMGGAVASGDINNDGAEDLIASYFDGQTHFEVLLNNGNGNLSKGPIMTVAGFPLQPIVLEDMNGDGRKDLIFTIKEPYAIYLALSQGDSFSTPFIIADSASLISVEDMNSDGRKDIIYFQHGSDPYQDKPALLINKPDNTFSKATLPLPAYTFYVSVKTIDYDKDGLPDLAIQASNPPGINVNIYHNSGNASFSLVSSKSLSTSDWSSLFNMVSGDFDRDGNLDLAGIKPDGFIYLWGSGNGSFISQNINGVTGFQLAAGDINADGISDIVVAQRSLTVSVLLGKRDRKIPSPIVITPNTIGRISSADVNGDGSLDILMSGGYQSGRTGSLYLNDGTGTFYLANPSISTKAIMISDLNGDGKADLVGADSNSLYIWPGTGSSNFSSNPITIPATLDINNFQIKDMDKDGFKDIVAIDTSDSNDMKGIILYLNAGFSASSVSVHFHPYFIIDDFNNDGYPDISGPDNTYLGSQGRAFAEVPNNLGMSIGYMNEPNLISSADFNGDGYPDIVASRGELIGVAYGRGNGTFYNQSILCSEIRTEGVLARDFNGDGWPDIAAGNTVFINDQQGRFLRTFSNIGIATRQLISADFNNDSLPDLAVTDFSNIVIVSHE